MNSGIGVQAAQAYHAIEEAYAKALSEVGNRAARRTPQGRKRTAEIERARKQLLTELLRKLEEAQQELAGSADSGAHDTPVDVEKLQSHPLPGPLPFAYEEA